MNNKSPENFIKLIIMSTNLSKAKVFLNTLPVNNVIISDYTNPNIEFFFRNIFFGEYKKPVDTGVFILYFF